MKTNSLKYLVALGAIFLGIVLLFGRKQERSDMRLTIAPVNTTFVPLSFEGPGCYSSAGGLGVRITNLSRALADQGFATHLFFIGDSVRRGDETCSGDHLSLHPWCQWISRYYPKGVYEGENQKLYDFNESIPWFVTEKIIKPALEQNKLAVIMGEEWHTAEAMCRISDRLHRQGLRDRVVMFWNANNTFGFDRIDWKRLSSLNRPLPFSRGNPRCDT